MLNTIASTVELRETIRRQPKRLSYELRKLVAQILDSR
jgi:hypothetical protein